MKRKDLTMTDIFRSARHWYFSYMVDFSDGGIYLEGDPYYLKVIFIDKSRSLVDYSMRDFVLLMDYLKPFIDRSKHWNMERILREYKSLKESRGINRHLGGTIRKKHTILSQERYNEWARKVFMKRKILYHWDDKEVNETVFNRNFYTPDGFKKGSSCVYLHEDNTSPRKVSIGIKIDGILMMYQGEKREAKMS